MTRPRLELTSTTLDAPDAEALASFYAALLGWSVTEREEDWVVLGDPSAGGRGLSFQTESRYVRPTWPAGPGQQQMMLHLEIKVDDLEGALRHAEACGAVLAEHQPQDDVRVCLDPAGHPFCLYL